MAVGHEIDAGRQRPRKRRGAGDGTARAQRSTAPTPDPESELEQLLAALEAARDGDFQRPAAGARARASPPTCTAPSTSSPTAARRFSKEVARVGRAIGREGRLTERAAPAGARRPLGRHDDALNTLIDDLVRPTTEVARVIDAVADGDLSQKMQLTIEGQPVKGEFRRIGTTVNAMVDQLSSFADEVTRVAREVGTDGKLGGQAKVKGVSGVWKDLTDNVNTLAANLTTQVRNIARGDDGGRERRPVEEDHRRRARRGRGAEEHDQHDGRPALARSPTRSRASRARSARRASSAARRRSRASAARGRT